MIELPSLELSAASHHGLMRALFDLSPLGMQLIDVRQRMVVAVNDAMVHVTGYSRDELIFGDGRTRFPEAMRATRDQWFVDAAAHGRFGPSEVEYIHKSGRIIHLLFNGVRVTEEPFGDYLWLNVQDVTSFRAMERELRTAASIDRLTGLANRATLMMALQHQLDAAAADPAKAFALLFLDFDRFKLVNDSLGHLAGDQLLCSIADRLRAKAARALERHSSDVWLVARFGGDEFVLLLPHCRSKEAAGQVAAALSTTLDTPHEIGDHSVQSQASVGIALWQPGIQWAAEMLRLADTAMYQAKRNGRGQHVISGGVLPPEVTRISRALR